LAKDRFILGSPDDVIEQLEDRIAAARRQLLHLPRRLAGDGDLEGDEGARADGREGAAAFPQEVWKKLKSVEFLRPSGRNCYPAATISRTLRQCAERHRAPCTGRIELSVNG
jgi:hypothetical protein